MKVMTENFECRKVYCACLGKQVFSAVLAEIMKELLHGLFIKRVGRSRMRDSLFVAVRGYTFAL